MIVYHGIDCDGWFSAALLISYDKSLADYMFPADYKGEKEVADQIIAAIQSDKPPQKIVICDFSFLPDAFKAIVGAAKQKNISVSWFDHHVSSINKLQSIPEISGLKGVRDPSNKVSAAKLVCDYLGLGDKFGVIIQTVSDYDIFNFDESKLSEQRAAQFNFGFIYDKVGAQEMVNRALDLLQNPQKIEKYIEIGTMFLKNYDAQVPMYLKDLERGEFEGKKYALVNSTEKIGAQLAQKIFHEVDFVIIWKAVSGKRAQLFLTSSKKGNTDVSVIAQRISAVCGVTGGGGHKNAAGAVVPLKKFVNFFDPEA